MPILKMSNTLTDMAGDAWLRERAFYAALHPATPPCGSRYARPHRAMQATRPTPCGFPAPIPNADPMPLILYQRDDCKLCDEALAVLAAARAPVFDNVWIDDDPQLEARYGTRVPVLRDTASGRELDWPFAPAAVQAFLADG